jgi:L-fuconolactonase
MSIPIVDAHQHFWDVERFHYPWITPQIDVLRRAFLPEHLKPILAKAGVDRTILVQALHSLAESRWLLELASANEFIAGVVVWVDLTSSSLGRDLDEIQVHPKFKGVRHDIEDEPDEKWMIRKDVLLGLTEIECRGIPFDLLVRPRHLKYIPILRASCPRLKLVVDHIAKPAIARGEMDPWARDLELVARLPNVCCKLSGMITEASWESWKPDDLKPFVEHVVRQFGYSRLMFGSDWPVCTLAGSYQQAMAALRHVLGSLSDADATKVWGGSAIDFYQVS